MIYIKSALFGLVAAMLGLAAWAVGPFIVMLLWLRTQSSTGAGGLGAVSMGVSEGGTILVALLSFILGSGWMYRRLRRRAAERKNVG